MRFKADMLKAMSARNKKILQKDLERLLAELK
jgi:hypothetical protein